VELRHEGLADYLRALVFWKNPSFSRGAALAQLKFDPSSQFATLLVATARAADDRGDAWQAIAKADVQLAIRALHLLVGEAVIEPRKPALRILDDIRLTIDTLVAATSLWTIGLSIADVGSENCSEINETSKSQGTCKTRNGRRAGADRSRNLTTSSESYFFWVCQGISANLFQSSEQNDSSCGDILLQGAQIVRRPVGSQLNADVNSPAHGH
jgi:hypothetical protein